MNERVTVSIPTHLHRDFKIETVRRGLQMKEATEQALKLWLKSKPAASAKREQLQPA